MDDRLIVRRSCGGLVWSFVCFLSVAEYFCSTLIAVPTRVLSPALIQRKRSTPTLLLQKKQRLSTYRTLLAHRTTTGTSWPTDHTSSPNICIYGTYVEFAQSRPNHTSYDSPKYFGFLSNGWPTCSRAQWPGQHFPVKLLNEGSLMSICICISNTWRSIGIHEPTPWNFR